MVGGSGGAELTRAPLIMSVTGTNAREDIANAQQGNQTKMPRNLWQQLSQSSNKLDLQLLRKLEVLRRTLLTTSLLVTLMMMTSVNSILNGTFLTMNSGTSTPWMLF